MINYLCGHRTDDAIEHRPDASVQRLISENVLERLTELESQSRERLSYVGESLPRLAFRTSIGFHSVKRY